MLFEPVKEDKTLYKFGGILWKIVTNKQGVQWVSSEPRCPIDSCRVELKRERGIYNCVFCKKEYLCAGGYDEMKRLAEMKWEAYKLLDYKVQSLDLPPTKVIDEAEDENYWVQARIGEKSGKKMAVIYFGEKLKGIQDKKDYVQSFIDFEDEQVRFDKNNKNPMKLLAKLTAEFPDSRASFDKREE